jgi:hypothetical protein
MLKKMAVLKIENYLTHTFFFLILEFLKKKIEFCVIQSEFPY